MKKVLALVLGLMLLAMPALAEDVDLAALSLDELVALRDRVDAEICARIPVNEAPFSSGIFLVGRDIKAGAYVIEWKSFLSADAGKWESFDGKLYASEADYEEGTEAFNAYYHTLYETEGSWAVVLSDGMVMTIEMTGSATIRSENNAFWAP
jgi:hypothetical protein